MITLWNDAYVCMLCPVHSCTVPIYGGLNVFKPNYIYRSKTYREQGPRSELTSREEERMCVNQSDKRRGRVLNEGAIITGTSKSYQGPCYTPLHALQKHFLHFSQCAEPQVLTGCL